MDWKSKRVEAILEQALLEDRATQRRNHRSYHRPRFAGLGHNLAKEDCVICGLGSIARFLEIFARLDKKASTGSRSSTIRKCSTECG